MAILFERIQDRDDLIKKLTLWRGERDIWLKYANYCKEIYYNDVQGTKSIFTQEQMQKIKSQWDIPVSINKIYPAISQEVAILAKSKPSIKVVAYDDRGEELAPILDKIVKHVLYSSEAELEEIEIIKDTITTGIGISYIELLNEYELGRLPIKYKRLDPEFVVLDPNTREKDLSDMSGFFIIKEITKEQALRYYQPLIDAVNEKYNAELTVDNLVDTSITKTSTLVDYEPRITVIEYYDKVYTNMYYVRDVNSGDILRLFKENLEEDQQFILESAEDIELNTFVRRKLILGNYLLLEEVLPLTKYPLKVKFFEWGGSIYKSYGLIHFVKDMQEALTKFIQLMIVNGMLSNNAGWIAPIGSIREEDRKKWETMGNVPGVIKEYLPQIIDGVLLKPEKENVQQLSQFFPFVIDLLASGIDIVSGINSAVRGEPKPVVEVFSTLRALQEAATYRIELAMTQLVVPNKDLGDVIIQYALSELKGNIKYILLDEREMEYLKLTSEQITTLKLSKYFVVTVPTEALPTKRLAQATELFKIAQTTTDQYTREMLIAESIRLTDIGNTKEILEKIDLAKRVSAQMEEMQNVIERLKELNKQLENRIVRAEIDNKILQELYKGAKAEINGTNTENPATEKTTLEKVSGI